MNKEETINKMKKGCLIIGIISCLIAAFHLFCSICSFFTFLNQKEDPLNSTVYFYQSLTNFMSGIIMIIVAIMFFYISKTGIPFTNKTMTMVRTIAVGLFFKAIVPVLIPLIILGYDRTLFVMMISNSPLYMLMGVLFLCMSYIVKYGAQLQQESDETL